MNPEMSPMTPPPNPMTNDCRSRPAAIIWSQIAPACASVFDFSPAGIVIDVGRNPAELKLCFKRWAYRAATFVSETMAHWPESPIARHLFPPCDNNCLPITMPPASARTEIMRARSLLRRIPMFQTERICRGVFEASYCWVAVRTERHRFNMEIAE